MNPGCARAFSRVSILAVALTSLGACSGGGGGGSALALNALYGGFWTVELTVMASTCGAPGSETTSVWFEQDAVGVVTMMDNDGDLTGVVQGRNLVLQRGDGFTSLALRMTGTGNSTFEFEGSVRSLGGAPCEQSVRGTATRAARLPMFHGEWTITSQVVTSTCGGEGRIDSQQVTMLQRGGRVEMSGTGEPFSGQIIGEVLTLESADGGSTASLQLAADGATFSGMALVDDDDGGVPCERELAVMAQRPLPVVTSAELWLDFERNIADATGNGHDGSAEPGFAFAGPAGAEFAGDFAATSLRVQDAADVAMDEGQAFTFGAWVHPQSYGPGQVVFGKSPHDVDPSVHVPALFIDDGSWRGVEAGRAYFDIYFRNVVGSPAPIPLHEWTHLAVTYDGTNVYTLFVDGAAVGSRQMAGANEGTAGTGDWAFTVGASQNGWPGGRFDGEIDDVVFFRRALSAGEVNTLALSGPVGL